MAKLKPNIFNHLTLKKGNYNYFAMAAKTLDNLVGFVPRISV
jgi:hypothetical protein